MDLSNASRPEWTRVGAPGIERIGIGLFYVCASLLFLLLQLSTLIVFLQHKDFRSHLCFLLMAVICAVDIPQLLVHAYGGIIAICDSSFSQYMEEFAGSLATSLSIVGFALELVLSLDRLLLFLPVRLLTARKERWLFALLVLLSLLLGLPFFLALIGPHSTVAFRRYAWDFADRTSRQNWDWVEKASEAIPFPFLVGTLLVYLAILGLMLAQRRKMGQPSQKAILSPQERRLLLQALAQFGVECSLCCLWIWQMLDPKGTGAYSFRVFVNFYWAFYCGFNPILYLAINRTIRERIFQLWHIQKQPKMGVAPNKVQVGPALCCQPQKKASFSSMHSTTNSSKGRRPSPFGTGPQALQVNAIHDIMATDEGKNVEVPFRTNSRA